MDKALRNQNSANLTLIEVTPDQLREIANRLDMTSQNAIGNEYTTVPLTRSITLCYNRKNDSPRTGNSPDSPLPADSQVEPARKFDN